MLRLTLTASSVYLAMVGLGLILFPLRFGAGAVPPDASSELIALLRVLGGPFLGIAALNWLSREVEPGRGLKRVLLANLIGFGAVAANDVWGVASGEARDLARIFLLVHLMFTAAFFATWVRTGDAEHLPRP